MATHEVIYRLKVDGNPADELEATARAAEAAARAEEHVAEASKQAAAAAKQAAAAEAEVERASQAAAHAGDKLESTAGKIGGSFNKLAGAASMVSPELGGMLRNVGDLADIGEVAGTAMSGLGLSVGGILTIAAPVAVAVAGLALAYKVFADELAAAEAQQKKSADAAAEAQKVYEDFIKVTEDLSAESRKATGVNADAQVALEKRIDAINTAIDAELKQAIVGKTYTQALEIQTALEDKRARMIDQAGAIYEADIGRTGRKTDAVREQTAAVKQLADAYQTIVAGGTTYTFGPGGGQTTTRGQLTGNQVGQLASANQDAAMLGGPLMTDEAIQAQLDAVDAVDKWNKALAESTDTMSKAQAALSKGAGMTGAVAGGPSSMLSAMGPWGALVDAIVKAVTHFADLGDSFTQYTADFNDALSKLPETLMDNLPKWLEEGTRSTVAMLPKLISTLIIEFFNPENWIKAAEGFIKGFSDGLTEGFSDWKAPSTSSGGSFDLFGALGGGAGTSGASSKSPDLVVKASDWWSDFTKSVDRETQQLGRAFA